MNKRVKILSDALDPVSVADLESLPAEEWQSLLNRIRAITGMFDIDLQRREREIATMDSDKLH